MTEHCFTINGSSESISLAGNPEVGAKTLLFQSGFLRYNHFDLYREGETEPLKTANLSEDSSFIAIPSGTSLEEYTPR